LFTISSDAERQQNYACDITVRNQQRVRVRLSARQHEVQSSDCVQRPHSFAIVDEVDSILIDEARIAVDNSVPAEAVADSTTKPIRSFRTWCAAR